MFATTLRPSRLAIGTAQFGFRYGIANQEGQVSQEAARAILDMAGANGIDTLDTAIAYGESEGCLGKIGTQSFKVITKIPHIPEEVSDISDWVREQFSASLLRLSLNSVYGLLLHAPNQLLGENGGILFESLKELQETNKVKKIGVSIYSPDELELIMTRYRFDLIQAPLNLLDRRLHNSGWLKRLKDSNVEVHTRSVFLQGLLLMAKTAIPAKFSRWEGIFERWHNWLAGQGRSAVKACLAFPLSLPEVDRIVIGVESVRQLEQIISIEATGSNDELPDLRCEDEDLINPSRWNRL